MGRFRALMPDRKLWTGGIFIVAAYMISALMNRYLGAGLAPDEMFLLSVALGKLAEYFVPPSLWDKIKRLNDNVISIAARVPDVPVSAAVGDVAATAVANDTGASTHPLAGSVAFEELMARIPPGDRSSGPHRLT